MIHKVIENRVEPERTHVLHVSFGSLSEAPWRLKEAIGLAKAIDLDVICSSICCIRNANVKTLIGKGWVQSLKVIIIEKSIQLLIVDGVLSPIQQRNLEIILDCRVMDRTGLILEIFGRRAETAEGVLQVELAALSYKKSRLVGSWSHLERQRGGIGFLGGPGESQLELDHRLLSVKIASLRKQLAQVRIRRKLQRRNRIKIPYPIIALVGYTNAGKSTLFNQLTQSRVDTGDALFTTLDPTLRQLKLSPQQVVILSDTVGFISDLPTTLIAAFQATLEEVLDAALLVHVRDISHPKTHQHKQEVLAVLTQLGLTSSKIDDMIEVCNKVDLLDEGIQKNSQACYTCANTGKGIPILVDKMVAFFNKTKKEIQVWVPSDNGRLYAWLHQKGEVFDYQEQDGGLLSLRMAVDTLSLGQLVKNFPQVRYEEINEHRACNGMARHG